MMANPNYVCILCSQTFTRRWRGNVHNINIHGGMSQTVRMVDYIVGRVSGNYLASDPALFRRGRARNRQTASSVSVNHRDTSYRRAHSSSSQEGYFSHSHSNPPSPGSVQQFNPPSPDPVEQMEEATIKMAELKRLAKKYLPPGEVQNTLSLVSRACIDAGNNDPIDMQLKILRRAVELKEAQDYLKGA
jgi:hypothetical protein